MRCHSFGVADARAIVYIQSYKHEDVAAFPWSCLKTRHYMCQLRKQAFVILYDSAIFEAFGSGVNYTGIKTQQRGSRTPGKI